LCLRLRPAPSPTLFPYTTLFRSHPVLRLVPDELEPRAARRAFILIANGGIDRRVQGRIGIRGCVRRQLAIVTATDRRDDEYDVRSEEHTSELQSLAYLVCRLLLE